MHLDGGCDGFLKSVPHVPVSSLTLHSWHVVFVWLVGFLNKKIAGRLNFGLPTRNCEKPLCEQSQAALADMGLTNVVG